MQLAERPCQTILHQIVRRGDIASKRAGIAPQARDLGFDALVDIGHENLSRWGRSAAQPI
jgi:hypothetical protein